MDAKKYDMVGNIMAYEQGDLDYEETVELFQHLLDSGTINHLQGSYGRMAAYLLNEGVVTMPQRKVA